MRDAIPVRYPVADHPSGLRIVRPLLPDRIHHLGACNLHVGLGHISTLSVARAEVHVLHIDSHLDVAPEVFDHEKDDTTVAEIHTHHSFSPALCGHGAALAFGVVRMPIVHLAGVPNSRVYLRARLSHYS